ncbi:hypothetical protein, partial [Paramuribaculum intestinale]|uniref:hypothetical protein n=1 Tax=Paramuribaculum intestinale TaxID=2094151 RepID=UPI0025B62DB8
SVKICKSFVQQHRSSLHAIVFKRKSLEQNQKLPAANFCELLSDDFATKLRQKSETRKDIVIELIYRSLG